MGLHVERIGMYNHRNQNQVMNLVIPFYNRNTPDQAADRLIFEAANAWRRVHFIYIFEESNVRDDITCIVIFFK